MKTLFEKMRDNRVKLMRFNESRKHHEFVSPEAVRLRMSFVENSKQEFKASPWDKNSWFVEQHHP